MRRKIVAGNWKMNKTTKEAIELINELIPLVANEEVDVVFCPPFLSTIAAIEATKGTNIKIGAQNMYFEDAGAYTGEISAQMLKEVGVEYVILGHSERRGYFGETNEEINKKVLKAIASGLKPILCVGEVLEQRDQGVTIDLVRMQVKIAMQNVTAEDAKNMIVAYEPVWAIGTGRTATADQAEEVCGAVRKVIEELYNKEVAEAIRIQYGGSVNGKNADELFAMPNIDGGLVGGSAIKADFGNIVNFKK